MLSTGSLVDGKYKILNKIGQGGMSVVYLAMNERANRQWAIKEIRKDASGDRGVIRQGLIAETDILKRLRNPHLPVIADIIDCEDSVLVVMDYIEGWTLEREFEENGPQSQETVIDWALQMCDVLGYLHSCNPPVIYRDVKPSNIMKRPDGSLVLIDFGTAREFKGGRTGDTTCLGTVGYAAPEQYGGRGETDARTDIYSLGVTLYYLLTGHNPGEPPYRIFPIRYFDPSFSAGLEKIIIKCTAKDPGDRYQSCAELMYDLQHYRQIDAGYRRFLKKKMAAFVLSAVLVVVCAGCWLGFRGAGLARQADTYEYYMRQAELGKSAAAKEEAFMAAAGVDPSRSEACLRLLSEVYLSDGIYEWSAPISGDMSEETEAQKMDELIGKFTGNRYDLAEIEYRTGIAVYYYGDGAGNKQGAFRYFRDVTETGFSSRDPAGEQKLERARCLSDISGYYNNLYIHDRSGDNAASFGTYWEDMKEIISGNIAQEDNYRTALVVYREFVTTLRDRTSDFFKAYVTVDDMLCRLSEISHHLDEDFDEFLEGENAAPEQVREEILQETDIIRGIIMEARQNIALLYD